MVRGVKQKRSTQEVLTSSSQRVTIQRTLLLDLLRQSDAHLDAYELYRRAQQKHPGISLSTVYRNLQLFQKLGLVEQHHFAEEHHYYEAKPATEHQHLLCLNCGKVVEFSCPLSRKFKEDLAKRYHFDITGVELRMTGLCSSCRSKEAQ